MSAKKLYLLSKGININKAYKQIESLIEQHNEVTVFFMNPSYLGDMDSYDLRKRVLTKEGKSQVAYKSHGYDNYSSFGGSCFVAGSEHLGYKSTLSLMRKHDGKKIVPVAIWYGPDSKHKIALGKKWEHINNISLKMKSWQSLVHRILKLKDRIMQSLKG